MTRHEFDYNFWEIWNRGLNKKDCNRMVNKKTPRQNPYEFLDFLFIASNIENPVILEIGKGHGNTEKFYRELLNAKDYISVDWKLQFNPTVYGNSVHKNTINSVKSLLRKHDNFADILFIDGDHNYQTVKSDYENYSPLIKSSGFIGFHDIHRIYSKTGAAKFWNEIKYQHKETFDIHYNIDWLMKPDKDGSILYEQIGIGVIKKI